MKREFFADVSGKGKLINTNSDYDEYVVRVGEKSGSYVHSETMQKKHFEGVLNGKTAKEQAVAFVDGARKAFDAKEKPATTKRGAK
jgi:hypothetical protein